ncbi:MAG TPA: glycosyltransferase [Pyrinomonadaceae bacterium]|nr:glycosyltransferase [Pyrinomonadaceae bacterium]
MNIQTATEREIEKLLILIPIFNDWEAVRQLLERLDDLLRLPDLRPHVLIVDDASTIPADASTFAVAAFKNIDHVSVIELRRNFGHQRAIALGLAYIVANLKCRAVVVMDGDGEDDPADVPRLIEKCAAEGYSKMVFARRTKRSEGFVFTVFYQLYKWFYKALTGHVIRFGNFSVVPFELVRRLVVVSEVWNHYAVGAVKAKLPCVEVSAARGRRLAGKPKMDFGALVMHGLSAISVFSEVVGVRLLMLSSVLIVLAAAGITVVVGIKFATTLAIPGWASYLVASLTIILVQAVSLSLFFVFMVLSARNNAFFLPLRDHCHFIDRVRSIFSVE